MKFQLINQLNPDFSTYEQILFNRQIPVTQVEHYLHTTEQDINHPEAFGQEVLRAAAAIIIQTVQFNKRIVIIVDCDCDGYTSSAILINYLHDLFPSYVENKLFYYMHDSKQHGLSDCIDQIIKQKNLGLVICPDSSRR